MIKSYVLAVCVFIGASDLCIVRAKQILLDTSFCNYVTYDAAGKPTARELIPRAGNVRPENGTYGREVVFRVDAYRFR
jgi:hypothetical protein